jgi:predicted ATPase
LSLQVAHELLQQFADGVFFIPLAPIADLALVAPSSIGTFKSRASNGAQNALRPCTPPAAP